MRITKVYTRQGDEGGTRLVGGQKIPKDDLRIEAYGTVDELNAVVGLVRIELARSESAKETAATLDDRLQSIQNDLFNLGSDLATEIVDRWEGMRLIEAKDTTRLEEEIDSMNESLAPLKDFILPGGGPVSAALHQARTVCRRGERAVVTLARRDEVNPEAIRYLNRLSDWYFVAGRWIASAMEVPEVLWDREH